MGQRVMSTTVLSSTTMTETTSCRSLPTDPDVRNERIRFLGSPQRAPVANQTGDTPLWRITVLTLALRDVVEDSGFRQRPFLT